VFKTLAELPSALWPLAGILGQAIEHDPVEFG
jgi:hypothetical protein